MDDEDFLDATPKGIIGNYQVEEEKLLSLAWKKISLDASIASEQPMNIYWIQIKEFFNAHNTSGYDRSVVSLRHQWSTICAECQMWPACLTHVKRLNPSDTNDGDKVIICSN